LSLATSGTLGASSTGAISTSATTTASQNEGTAQIAGLDFNLLGTPLLSGSGSVITADASCPTNGQPTASTNLAGLEVLGSSVNLAANASTTETAAVTSLPAVLGLTASPKPRR